MEHPLGLQAQSESSIRLGLLELVLLDALDRVRLQKLFFILVGDEVFGGNFVEVDVLSDGIGGELIQDAGVFAAGVFEHMGPPSHEVV